jgi:hypothetical protein
MFAESAVWLRWPAGVAAAGGLATVLAAMVSASAADVTGVIAGSAAVLGTFFAFSQRRKILVAYHEQMEAKRKELTTAVELQMHQAVDVFYNEIAAAFQPLAAFCTAERARYEPLLRRVEELKANFAGLKQRLNQPL